MSQITDGSASQVIDFKDLWIDLVDSGQGQTLEVSPENNQLLDEILECIGEQPEVKMELEIKNEPEEQVEQAEEENKDDLKKWIESVKEKTSEVRNDLEMKQEVEEEETNDADDEWTPPTAKKRPMRQTRKRVQEASSGKRISGELSSRCKTKKLYQHEKFDDPAKERQRINAINAKINREKKKKEKLALVGQMDYLRKEVERLGGIEEEVVRLREENRRLKMLIADANK